MGVIRSRTFSIDFVKWYKNNMKNKNIPTLGFLLLLGYFKMLYLWAFLHHGNRVHLTPKSVYTDIKRTT